MSTGDDNRAEYFVSLLRRKRILEAVIQSSVLTLPSEQRAKLAELTHEVRELQGRLGFSVRRRVNILLRSLGEPEVPK